MAAAPFVDLFGYPAKYTHPIAIPLSASYRATGAAGGAAAVTLDADTARRNVISQIHYSYSAAPTGGLVKVEDGSGTTVFEVDVTAAGPGVIEFSPHRVFTVNTATIVTLAAPGGAVVGKVNVMGYKLL